MQLTKIMETLSGKGTGSLLLGGQKYMVIGTEAGDVGASVRGKKGKMPRRFLRKGLTKPCVTTVAEERGLHSTISDALGLCCDILQAFVASLKQLL